MNAKFFSFVFLGLFVSTSVHAGSEKGFEDRAPTIHITSPVYGELTTPKDFKITWDVLEPNDEFLGFYLINTYTGKREFVGDAMKVRAQATLRPRLIEPGNYRLIGYHYGRKQPRSLAAVSDDFLVNYTYDPFWTTEKDAKKLCPIFSGLDDFYVVEKKVITCEDRNCVDPLYYSYISDKWIMPTTSQHRLPENKEIIQIQCIP